LFLVVALGDFEEAVVLFSSSLVVVIIETDDDEKDFAVVFKRLLFLVEIVI
jgi:hypothetical protein